MNFGQRKRNRRARSKGLRINSLRPSMEQLEDRIVLTVAVFNDPAFVSPAESASVQSALNDLSLPFETFEGTSAAQVTVGLANASILLVPELGIGDLAAELPSTAAGVIRKFVSAGGGLIINGSEGVNDTAFLNSVFEINLLDGVSDIASTRSAVATGTAFADDPAALPDLPTTSSLITSSLPPTALPLYTLGANTTVATFPFNGGNVTYLGWDW